MNRDRAEYFKRLGHHYILYIFSANYKSKINNFIIQSDLTLKVFSNSEPVEIHTIGYNFQHALLPD